MKNRQSTSVDVAQHKGTEHPELRMQYLNSLQKLVFPLSFLQANHVVLANKSFEVAVLLLFSRCLWRRRWNPAALLEFHEAHRKPLFQECDCRYLAETLRLTYFKGLQSIASPLMTVWPRVKMCWSGFMGVSMQRAPLLLVLAHPC